MFKSKLHLPYFNIKLELRRGKLTVTLKKFQSNALVFTKTHSKVWVLQ
jgi:hypothetical protein